MRLKAFLEQEKENNVPYVEWARRIGITRGYLTQLANGKRNPSLRIIIAIEDATEGKVTLRDFV